ncbi:MAG: TraX family protein [Cellulosilyticaceae bacterium]
MLKLAAISLMLIDHIGVTLIPETATLYWICRMIGRLAMPIFCYQLAQGFLRTKDLMRYAKRIGLMTLAAQIPFAWMCFGIRPSLIWLTSWNVGLTFLCAIGFLWCFKSEKYLLAVPLLLLANFADYGLYGIVLVTIFYFHHIHTYKWGRTTLLLIVANLIFYGLSGSLFLCLLQMFSVGSILLILILEDKSLSLLPRTFFYAFYPLHMLILVILRDIFMA